MYMSDYRWSSSTIGARLSHGERNNILLKMNSHCYYYYFTGDHSNQDLRSTKKTIYLPILTNHISSWLLCTPVNICSTSSHYLVNYHPPPGVVVTLTAGRDPPSPTSWRRRKKFLAETLTNVACTVWEVFDTLLALLHCSIQCSATM